jgi:hypothetical protein
MEKDYTEVFLKTIYRAVVAVLLIACVFFLCAGFPGQHTTAIADSSTEKTTQQDASITISPINNRIKIDPNSKYDGTITVRNSDSNSLDIRLYAAPYSVNDLSYEQNFETDKPRTQISRWISFENDKYDVPGKGKVSVPYHINVPKDVPAGGQYAVIFVEQLQRSSSESDANVNVVMRAGMLIYATVSGKTRDEGTVLTQNIQQFVPMAKMATNFIIKNTGNTDFNVKCSLDVSSFFGGSVYTSKTDSKFVLPDTEREVYISWDDSKMGVYRVTQTVEFLGYIQVVERYVVVFHAWLMALIGLILIGVLIVLLVLLPRKRRRIQEQKRGRHGKVHEKPESSNPDHPDHRPDEPRSLSSILVAKAFLWKSKFTRKP